MTPSPHWKEHKRVRGRGGGKRSASPVSGTDYAGAGGKEGRKKKKREVFRLPVTKEVLVWGSCSEQI